MPVQSCEIPISQQGSKNLINEQAELLPNDGACWIWKIHPSKVN